MSDTAVKTTKITKLYAFVLEKDGNEGLLGLTLPTGECIPLVGTSPQDVQKIKAIIDNFAMDLKAKYEIRQFQIFRGLQ